MEIYILDSLLRRTQVVDQFDSLIWTERWREIGDFELELNSTLANRSRFMVGTQLAINNSYRVMTVETVEDTLDDEGRSVLNVKGRSLESLLEDRVFKDAMSDSSTTPVLEGTAGNVAREMFDHICRDLTLNAGDAIPFLQLGSIFPAPTIPESTTIIRWEQPPDLLKNAIKSVCSRYDLGFRLVRNFDASELYFDIYTGDDRTTEQTTLPPVVFSPDFESLENMTEFTNIQNSKNVAYVFDPLGFAVVYGANIDPTIDGFDRRIIVVNTNVDPAAPDINAELVQAGNEALANRRALSLFDGEINEEGSYIYGVDYNLGDLVEMRNKDNVVTKKRVTEQIFVQDANGERSYPTLSMGTFPSLDTWLAYGNDATAWADMTTEEWADM